MKKRYKIEVDCANCAAKIEDAVRRIDGVTSVTVAFMSQKLTLEAPDEVFDDILAKAVKAARRIEPDFSIQL